MLYGTTSNMLLHVIWSIRQVILSEKKQNCLQMLCSNDMLVFKILKKCIINRTSISAVASVLFVLLTFSELSSLPSPLPVDLSKLWRTEECRYWSLSRLALSCEVARISFPRGSWKFSCSSFQELGQPLLHQLGQYLSLLLDLEPVNTTEWNVEE